MGKTIKIPQTSFKAGELAPNILGDTTTEAYRNGLKDLNGWVSSPYGGIIVCPGTKYLLDQLDETSKCRLIPFVNLVAFDDFSVVKSGFVEITDQDIRVIEEDGTTVSVGTSGTDSYSQWSNNPPWAEADLPLITYNQFNSELLIFHPLYPPGRLRLAGAGTYSIVPLQNGIVDSFYNGPWLPLNGTVTTLTPGGATVGLSRALTASANLFAATDVGRHVRISNPSSGTQWGWGIIDAVTDAQNATFDIYVALATTNATTNWQLGAYSYTTGWPRFGFVAKNRLFLGGSGSRPNMVFASSINPVPSGTYSIYNFEPSEVDGDITDSHAIREEVGSIGSGRVLWGQDTNHGVVFGTDAEVVVINRNGTSITPDNVTIEKAAAHGSEDNGVNQMYVGGVVGFVQKGARILRTLEFQFQNDAFSAVDISYLANHLPKDVVRLAYQRVSKRLWMLLSGGSLVCMTYDPEHGVFSCGTRVIGGTDVVVEDIGVIPGDRDDELWMTVKRTVNGGTVRYVEILQEAYNSNEGDALEDAWYVDSGVSYSGAAATTISGFTHLIGETVEVLADGASHPDVVVNASGQIELVRSATKVQAGLRFEKEFTTLPPIIQDEQGGTLDVKKRIVRVTVRFLDTNTIKCGRDANNLKTINFRVPSDSSLATPLKTIIKDQVILGEWGEEPTLTFKQDLPLPAAVLAVQMEVMFGDR